MLSLMYTARNLEIHVKFIQQESKIIIIQVPTGNAH